MRCTSLSFALAAILLLTGCTHPVASTTPALASAPAHTTAAVQIILGLLIADRFRAVCAWLLRFTSSGPC